jgi:choline dehydrogenase-like flavoprotein
MSAGEWEHYLGHAERYLGARADQFAESVRHRRVAERLRPVLEAAGRTLTDQSMAGRVRDATRIHYNATADILAGGTGHVSIHRGDARLRARGRRSVVEVDGVPVFARAVVVAAGAIDTPRLLWEAGIRPGALGRHLTYHPVIAAQVVLDDGLWSDAPAPDPPPRLQIPPDADHPWNTMVLRDFNPFPPDPDGPAVPANRLIELQLFCGVDPHPDNRMSFGSEGVSFDVPLRDADEERRTRMMEDALALGAALGGFRRGGEPGWLAPGLAHIMGTCRMSVADDGSGVAAPDGRVWGMDDLYLATVGLIPTRLAVNPTLTGVALAIRTADRIAQEATA